MKALLSWSSSRLILLAACLPFSSCKHEKPSPRNTPDYLSQAVDLSHFFRWTFPLGLSDCRLYIEVDDRDGFVPAGFDRPASRNRIEGARDAWKTAIRANNVPMESQTRFLSEAGTTPFPRDYAIVKVSFVDRLAGSLIGSTQTFTTGAGRVDYVEVKLALRDPQGQLMSNSQQLTTALHEFGHALGIGCNVQCGSNQGHSPDSHDIMYPTSVPYTSLSGGDKKAVQHLYSLSPQVIREDA